MNPEIKENFAEKIRLANIDIIKSLDKQIRVMLAEHSRDGMIGSGNTIRKTMDFIEVGSSKLYQTVLDHLCTLSVDYHPMLETEIRALAKSAHDTYKEAALDRLNKNTIVARSPQLYERMLPEVKEGFSTDMANFHNTLNVAILELKQSNTMPISTKIFWSVEASLLLASMFIAGMWFKDPDGNYEPILVGLALVIPLLAIVVRFSAKK
ncbi:MAG: hypothetical protein V7731_21800 [Amphritea sp.]